MKDFKAELEKQLKFIERSCAAYDTGAFEEAIRIAVTLRVIFHDTKMSTSLLRHLNCKDVSLVSTAEPFADEAQLGEVPSLYLVELVGEVPDLRCVAHPLLDKNFGHKHLKFPKWWDGEVVIDLKKGNGSLTRKKLILEAANADGGAHVGETLDARYQKAMEGAGLSMEIIFEKILPPKRAVFQNIHFATLRQIAFEVLHSPELLTLAGR